MHPRRFGDGSGVAVLSLVCLVPCTGTLRRHLQARSVASADIGPADEIAQTDLGLVRISYDPHNILIITPFKPFTCFSTPVPGLGIAYRQISCDLFSFEEDHDGRARSAW